MYGNRKLSQYYCITYKHAAYTITMHTARHTNYVMTWVNVTCYENYMYMCIACTIQWYWVERRLKIIIIYVQSVRVVIHMHMNKICIFSGAECK